MKTKKLNKALKRRLYLEAAERVLWCSENARYPYCCFALNHVAWENFGRGGFEVVDKFDKQLTGTLYDVYSPDRLKKPFIWRDGYGADVEARILALLLLRELV